MSRTELRSKMFSKETAWGKYLRLNELARHRKRCREIKCSIDNSAPVQGPRQRMNRVRSDLEQVLGGATNCVGKYKIEEKKVSDCKPCSIPKVTKEDRAPFSSVKISPQDEKMRVHMKNIMNQKKKLEKIQKDPSIYTPRKRNYLYRGECPWYHKPVQICTVDEKLKEIRKWAMRHRMKTPPPAPTGIMAYIPAIFLPTPPEPEPQFFSPITDEDAEKSPDLAQLKAVQEAGDPSF